MNIVYRQGVTIGGDKVKKPETEEERRARVRRRFFTSWEFDKKYLTKEKFFPHFLNMADLMVQVEGAGIEGEVWPRSKLSRGEEEKPQRHHHFHRPRDWGCQLLFSWTSGNEKFVFIRKQLKKIRWTWKENAWEKRWLKIPFNSQVSYPLVSRRTSGTSAVVVFESAVLKEGTDSKSFHL